MKLRLKPLHALPLHEQLARLLEARAQIRRNISDTLARTIMSESHSTSPPKKGENFFDYVNRTRAEAVRQATHGHRSALNRNKASIARTIEQIQSERNRQLEKQKLEHKAYTDVPTGLRNRNHYEEVLLPALAQLHPDENVKGVWVVLYDLNNLHGVNEKLTYAGGNKYIKKAAELIAKHHREDDHLFAPITEEERKMRTGGDEMLAVAVGAKENSIEPAAMRVQKAFQKWVDEQPEFEGLSAGITYATHFIPLPATKEELDHQIMEVTGRKVSENKPKDRPKR